MDTLKHIPERSVVYRWARFSRAGTLSLASMLLAVGCSQEATAPQHRDPMLPQVVSARKPIEHFHDRFTGSFTTEICGIPAEGEFVTMNNFFLHEDGSFRLTVSGSTTLTNPANGKSVVISFAGHRPSAAPIMDAEAGTITFVTTFKGLDHKIQTANGPVLLQDVGMITFVETFDLETGAVVSSEIIVNKGPHPDYESGLTLFCEVVSSALT
jgi:hypothetical protein